MGVARGLAVQVSASLGKVLLQVDVGVFVCFDQLYAGCLHHEAAGWVRDGLVLHRVVDDHSGDLLRIDQLALDRHVDGFRQQLLKALFAQQLPELNEGGCVALAVKFKLWLPATRVWTVLCRLRTCQVITGHGLYV